MNGQNSLADVFRFMQIRPTRPSSEVEAISLDDTEIRRALAAAPTLAAQISLADRVLADRRRSVSTVEDLSLGDQLLDALGRARKQEAATIGTLLAELGEPDRLALAPSSRLIAPACRTLCSRPP